MLVFTPNLGSQSNSSTSWGQRASIYPKGLWVNYCSLPWSGSPENPPSQIMRGGMHSGGPNTTTCSRTEGSHAGEEPPTWSSHTTHGPLPPARTSALRVRRALPAALVRLVHRRVGGGRAPLVRVSPRGGPPLCRKRRISPPPARRPRAVGRRLVRALGRAGGWAVA